FAEAQTDPVGPASGFARVVRGGGIMGPSGKGADGFVPYYRRSANRASVAPAFSGAHPIGIRLVEGELPATVPQPAPVTFPLSFVKSNPRARRNPPRPRQALVPPARPASDSARGRECRLDPRRRTRSRAQRPQPFGRRDGRAQRRRPVDRLLLFHQHY